MRQCREQRGARALSASNGMGANGAERTRRVLSQSLTSRRDHDHDYLLLSSPRIHASFAMSLPVLLLDVDYAQEKGACCLS